ncbi:hypothetical protein G3I40_46190 [Streptomyces sp. SID14478]|uniref:hypothetical protein n=1 Tax=Streptomyces sp. SID14478 TaxID=2706073 RepID=UPI0013E0D724|nr:hypothetical protein [Streptomyces sp. SID14478]NEB82552.1 hypothetical protein [Streptomyces sp. SID14478]
MAVGPTEGVLSIPSVAGADRDGCGAVGAAGVATGTGPAVVARAQEDRHEH